MTTFALLHGGCHTANCWEPLARELRGRGHQVLTPELAVSDIHSGPDQYLQRVVAVLEYAEEAPVVVAHSQSGWVSLRLVEQVPVTGLVLLCSYINFPADAYPDMPGDALLIKPEDAVPDEHGLITLDPKVALDVFYHDCPAPAAERALRMLVPHAVAGMAGPTGPVEPISVPSVYIRSEEDHIVGSNWSEWAAQLLTGRPCLVLPGSHSPFLSRPVLLADTLEQLTSEFSERA